MVPKQFGCVREHTWSPKKGGALCRWFADPSRREGLGHRVEGRKEFYDMKLWPVLIQNRKRKSDLSYLSTRNRRIAGNVCPFVFMDSVKIK